MDNDYDVRIGRDPYWDLVDIAIHGLGGKSVVAIAYDPAEFNYNDFSYKLKLVNETWLLRNDILALAVALRAVQRRSAGSACGLPLLLPSVAHNPACGEC